MYFFLDSTTNCLDWSNSNQRHIPKKKCSGTQNRVIDKKSLKNKKQNKNALQKVIQIGKLTKNKTPKERYVRNSSLLSSQTYYDFDKPSGFGNKIQLFGKKGNIKVTTDRIKFSSLHVAAKNEVIKTISYKQNPNITYYFENILGNGLEYEIINGEKFESRVNFQNIPKWEQINIVKNYANEIDVARAKGILDEFNCLMDAVLLKNINVIDEQFNTQTLVKIIFYDVNQLGQCYTMQNSRTGTKIISVSDVTFSSLSRKHRRRVRQDILIENYRQKEALQGHILQYVFFKLYGTGFEVETYDEGKNNAVHNIHFNDLSADQQALAAKYFINRQLRKGKKIPRISEKMAKKQQAKPVGNRTEAVCDQNKMDLVVSIEDETGAKICTQQCELIQNRILVAIDAIKPNDFVPSFDEVKLINGVFNIWCNNLNSKKWFIRNWPLWVDTCQGTNLKIIGAKDFKFKVAVCIPGSQYEGHLWIERIQKQNFQLQTDQWKIDSYANKINDSGPRIIYNLTIDEHSYNVLSGQLNWIVQYGLFKLQFREIKRNE